MTRVGSGMPTAQLTRRDQQGGGLSVEFLRTQGCYGHRIIGLGQDDATAVLLESIEGISRPPWPESPALQGLNVDDLQQHDSDSPGQQPSAMLIGMAADGHWSLSIEPLKIEGVCGFLFDVACRVKTCPASLTSTYRLAESVVLEDPGEQLQLENPIGRFTVVPLPVESDRDFDSDACRLLVGRSGIQLARETQWSDEAPTTLRWKYEIRMIN